MTRTADKTTPLRPAGPQILVVNARHLDRVPAGYALIYVGRSTSYKPAYGADFSLLGNPFTLASGYSRDEAVDAYAERAARGVPLLVRRALDVLQERARMERVALVCFCAPQRCHADVLASQLAGGEGQ